MSLATIADSSSQLIEEEPYAKIPTSVVVVGAFLVLEFLFCAVYYLYLYDLAPSRIEGIWHASQGKPNQPSARAAEGTVVTLVRTQCFGTCPEYRLSIHASGLVEFRGGAFVCKRRPAPIFIEPSAVAKLVDGMTAVSFEQMPSYTHVDMTDAPSAIVTLRRPNSVHIVEHYSGDSAAPRLLNMIEDRIDMISRSYQWVEFRNGSKLQCAEGQDRSNWTRE